MAKNRSPGGYTKNGHVVVAVEKISHAIEELSGGHFDLVLCDGQLEDPGDGADFAKQLADEGRRVSILSSDSENMREGVPFIHKKDWGSESLTEALNRPIQTRSQ